MQALVFRSSGHLLKGASLRSRPSTSIKKPYFSTCHASTATMEEAQTNTVSEAIFHMGLNTHK